MSSHLIEVYWTAGLHTKVDPGFVVALHELKALGGFFPRRFEESLGFMQEFVGIEFQINQLHVAVVEIMGDTANPDVERVAAVVIAACVLDRQSPDISPGEPGCDTRGAELAALTPKAWAVERGRAGAGMDFAPPFPAFVGVVDFDKRPEL